MEPHITHPATATSEFPPAERRSGAPLDGDVEPTELDRETTRLILEVQAMIESGGDGHVARDRFCRHLFASYGPPIFAYLKVVFDDDHEAEDATQEVMSRALIAAETYQAHRAPFRIWLFRVARNYAINHRRKHLRVEVTSPSVLDIRCERRQAERSARTPTLGDPEFPTDTQLFALVRRLPLEQRQVVALRFILDLSLKEAAGVLGCSENAVSQLQGRALAFMRARLAGRRAQGGSRGRLPMGRRDRFSRVLSARRNALAFLGNA